MENSTKKGFTIERDALLSFLSQLAGPKKLQIIDVLVHVTPEGLSANVMNSTKDRQVQAIYAFPEKQETETFDFGISQIDQIIGTLKIFPDEPVTVLSLGGRLSFKTPNKEFGVVQLDPTFVKPGHPIPDDLPMAVSFTLTGEHVDGILSDLVHAGTKTLPKVIFEHKEGEKTCHLTYSGDSSVALSSTIDLGDEAAPLFRFGQRMLGVIAMADAKEGVRVGITPKNVVFVYYTSKAGVKVTHALAELLI